VGVLMIALGGALLQFVRARDLHHRRTDLHCCGNERSAVV
jgi:hypothetical protein